MDGVHCLNPASRRVKDVWAAASDTPPFGPVGNTGESGPPEMLSEEADGGADPVLGANGGAQLRRASPHPRVAHQSAKCIRQPLGREFPARDRPRADAEGEEPF
jgi:hypothetical protein